MGSKAGVGVRGGEDVVDAELYLRLRLVQRCWVQLARSVTGGQWTEGLGVSGSWGVRAGGSESVHRLTEAHLEVSAAPASAEVAVLKEVQHGLAACGKRPEIALPLLIAFSTRHLCSTKQDIKMQLNKSL